MTTTTRRPISRRAGALAVTLALAVAACGSDDDASSDAGAGDSGDAATSDTASGDCDLEGTLTISNWGDPNDQAVYTAAAERFEAAHPCVDIVDNFTPITTWSDYVNKLVSDVAAGSAPDVINIAIEGLRLGVDKDLFLPLDDYVASGDVDEYLDDVDDRLLDALAVDGTQYLLPSTWNNMLIYYNTEMFEAAGIERPSDDWTWDDFLEIAQQLTTGDGADQVFGFAIPSFNFGWTPWFYSNGTSEVDDDLLGSNLDDPAMAESAQFIADLVNVHGVAPAVEGADPYQLFPAGKVAMTGAGHWVVGGFEEAGFDTYDVLPWPKNTDKQTVFGTSGFGIYSGADDPDLAWAYIQELISTETGRGFAEIGAGIPARSSLTESPEFTAMPPTHELFYDSLDFATPVAAPFNFNELEAIMNRAMGEILAGTQTADEAFADAHEELQASFDNG
jgi:multiple sugar transport system substrate-binding protein